MKRSAIGIFALLFCTCAVAQVPIAPKFVSEVQHTFDTLPSRNTLDCRLTARQPTLDFTFRFVTGFVFECPLQQFPAGKAELSGYFLISPRNGAPAFMTDYYHAPPVASEMLAKFDLEKKKVSVASSGAFAVGEGEYKVDALIVDQGGRFFHKSWPIRARQHAQSGVPWALAANSVAYIGGPTWDGKLAAPGTGTRLSILLDAAPINPTQTSLRAWDRAFLLQALSAVLQKVRGESVRVVAFNLDQQREIYRNERFDKGGFEELARALRRLETGTVSYKAIQRDHATEILARLANEQLDGNTETVIFLGPSSSVNQKAPLALLNSNDGRRPRFYYLEYFPHPGGFPDAIEYLTKGLHGTVFQLHSPGDLARAIPRIAADAPAPPPATSADASADR